MVWLAMLASIVVYAVLPEIIGTIQQRTNLVFFEAMAAVAIACIFLCFLFRRRFVTRAATVLVKDPTDIVALKRWQTGHILHFSSSLAVTLYGLVLRYAGFSLSEVWPFYVAGLALMFYGMSRKPK